MYGLGAILQKTKDVSYNQGLRDYMLGVYNYMTAALAVSGLTAFFLAKTGLAAAITFSPLGILFALLPVGLSMYISARIMTARFETLKSLFIIYSIAMGASLSGIFLVFTQTEIARAFFVTASTFGSMSIYGYVTKKDLSSLGSSLTMVVLGLFIASIVNIFFRSSAMSFAISFISVIAFTVLVAYDTQNIKRLYYNSGSAQSRIAILGALQLYIDFVAIFIHLLNLLAATRSNRD
jgi:FtsH-binding integral membrane protein